MGAITFLRTGGAEGQAQVSPGSQEGGGTGTSWGLSGDPLAESGKRPVLFDEDAQGLLVGEDGVGIQAEVEFALRVLPTSVPGGDRSVSRGVKRERVGRGGTVWWVGGTPHYPLTRGRRNWVETSARGQEEDYGGGLWLPALPLIRAILSCLLGLLV